MSTGKTNISINIRSNHPRGYCIDVYRFPVMKKVKGGGTTVPFGPTQEERYLARTIEEVETAVSQLFRSGKTAI